MFLQFLLLLSASQVLLLLLSPRYKSRTIFKWYYNHVIVPVLKDNNRYRWKFHVVPLFYLSLYVYIIYMYYAYIRNLILPYLYTIEDVLLIPIFLIAIIATGLLTMFTRPKSSLDQDVDSPYRYKYDKIIFFPNIVCRTCHVVKPARSRHCGICNRCVLLQDHHCIWVNNCIGQGNFLYFYLFLVLNTVALAYGFIKLIALQLFFRVKLPKIALTISILCGTLAVLCGVFTYMQLSLVRDGMTTNEQEKWYVIQEYMRAKELFRTASNEYFIPKDSSKDARNRREFYSVNPYDDKIYRLRDDPLMVERAEDIVNIYDKGSFWKNLKEFCL